MLYVYQPKIMRAGNINHLQTLLTETLSGSKERPRAVGSVPHQAVPGNHQLWVEEADAVPSEVWDNIEQLIRVCKQRPLWVRLMGDNHAIYMKWALCGAWAVFIICLLLSLMGVGR